MDRENSGTNDNNILQNLKQINDGVGIDNGSHDELKLSSTTVYNMWMVLSQLAGMGWRDF